MVAALAPDSGEVKLGASLKMAFLRSRRLELPDPTDDRGELQRDFPHESIGALRSLAGAFQFSGDEIDVQFDRLGRRKDPAGDCAHAARSTEFPR
jgi:ATPase subunit of ABC transporter with duplicated ATPase domains